MKFLKLFLLLTFVPSVCFISCKPKDSDIQTDINNKLKDKPELSAITATVESGVATLSGQVKSEEDRNSATALAKEINGVDSVNNNTTIDVPDVTPSATVLADDKMMEEVKSIIKNHPNINASVSGGIITLTGTIKKESEQKLLDSMQTLNPTNIDNQLTEQ